MLRERQPQRQRTLVHRRADKIPSVRSKMPFWSDENNPLAQAAEPDDERALPAIGSLLNRYDNGRDP